MSTDTTDKSADTVLAQVAVEMGLATSEEVQECIEQQRKVGSEESQRSIAELMVAQGIVTEPQLKRVMKLVDAQRSTHQIPGYQVISELGAGAMARVYKARQLSLDRIVAVKTLPQKYMDDPNFVDRFYAEGRAAAKLNHPNIVQAIDVGKSGDFHYFVMEYVEGHTVFDHLTKSGRYNEPEALEIIVQMAEALDHAHSAGFIHRDVKPKNIMITKEGDAKLADMGLARSVSDREAAEAEAGRAYGTPYYISPEQIRGERDIDFRADIYGLGATFYHMVTGRVPFEAPNPSAVMHKHLKSELTPPDHIVKELSAGIGEIIEVMMAKDRAQRYASTAYLLEDLRAVQAGEPPLQARKKFDIGGLAGLEPDMTTTTVSIDAPSDEPPPGPSILEQPLFWTTVGLVTLCLILFILLMISLMKQPPV